MTRKHIVALAGAGALVLAGAGAALALAGGPARGSAASPAAGDASFVSTSGGLHRFGLFGARGFGLGRLAGRLLQAASDYLGVPVDTLRSDLQAGTSLADVANATTGKSASGLVEALVADATSKLDAAVKAGKLTQAQADAITPKLRQGITALVNGKLPTAQPTAPGVVGPRGIGPWGLFQTAASYLGVPASTLWSDLRSGKSLADVANATPGRSASGLVDALVSHETAALDAAVKAGKLTQAQEDAITPMLKQGIIALVDGTPPAMPLGPWHGHGGHGDWSPPTGGANA